ncbi:MAG TPA: polysaccharide biosynthesis tyrosine autokinase, partial [Mariprofundaceae bacterium]|nr:polysaccharide biosynthesis tyrosine autokinase [Mariprofundaceae bacterium]
LTNVSDLGFGKSLQRRLRGWIDPPASSDQQGWGDKTRFFLARMIGDPGPVGSLVIRDLHVDPRQRGRVLTLALLPDASGLNVIDAEGHPMAQCKVGSVCRLAFDDGGISFVPAQVVAGHQTRLTMSFRSLDNAARMVRHSISTDELLQGGGNFLKVNCKWPDPYQARLILNELADAYLMRDQKDVTRSYDQMIAFLDDNLDPMEVSLEGAERKLRDFLQQHGILDMSQNYTQGLDNIAALDQKKVDNELRKRELAYLADVLSKADPVAYGSLVSEVSDDLAKDWEQLQERTVELDAEGEALHGFTENYVPMKKHMAAVKLLEQRKIELKNAALRVIQEKQKLLLQSDNLIEEQIAQIERGMGLDPETQNGFMRLQRQKTIAEKLYNLLLEKREEMKLSKAGAIADMQVLDPPEEGYQVAPNLPRNLLMGGMLGLLLTGLLAFVRETLDIAIRDPDEIERVTGLYVHGMVPAHKEAEENVGLVTLSRPTSVDAEAYRSLRTSIQLASLENQVGSIMITSSGPGEGKSTTMCNLAVTLAQSGRKTLVVDCDMRRPVVGRYLEVPSEPGLAEVLDGKLDWHESVRPTAVEGLFALPAGSIPPNPSELIGRAKMAQILSEMKQEYDFVLCDVPPILVVSDAALLASHVDGVLILVRAGKAVAHAVKRASDQMQRVGGTVLGAIFNAYSGRSGGYGNYGGYYHQEETPEAAWFKRLADKLRRGGSGA